MNTAMTAYIPPDRDRGDLFWDPAAMRHALELAATLAASGLVPKHFQGKAADVLIALQIAHRSGRDPWTVIQSIYVVGGRPGWAATYLIALSNAAGFPIRWRVERRPERLQFEREQWGDQRGEKRRVKASMPDLTVTAYSPAAPDDEVSVTSQLAIDEGWASNSKYSTLGEQMLRYRAATLLVRLYHPELLLGIPVADELDDTEAAANEPAPRIMIPATTAAATAAPRGVAGIAAALSPTTTASAAAEASTAAQEPKKDPIKDSLLSELRELYRTDPATVTEACRQHSTAPNQIGRLGPEKLSAILATARKPVAEPEPEPSEETMVAIGEWCLSLDGAGKGDKVTAAFVGLGIDPEKGPTTEAQSQALLAALKLAGA